MTDEHSLVYFSQAYLDALEKESCERAERTERFLALSMRGRLGEPERRPRARRS